MRDEKWWDRAWDRYLDTHPNLTFKEMESPQEFAKFLEENRLELQLRRLTILLWVVVVTQCLWDIIFSALFIYTLWIERLG